MTTLIGHARPHLRFVFITLALIGCDSTQATRDAGHDAGISDPTDAGSEPADAGPMAETFAEIGAATEGIALGRNAADEPVLYVGTGAGRILEIDASAEIREVAAVNAPLGIAWRGDGSLVVCAKTDADVPAILTVTREGVVATLVDHGPDDASLELPNFVAIAPDGSIVFSDTMTGLVLRADADGQNVASITDAIPGPNGLAFSRDGATLYVAAWSGAAVYALSFDRATSTYGAPEITVASVRNVDGVTTTSEGDLVLTTSVAGTLLATPGASEPPITLLGARAIPIVANSAFGAGTLGGHTLYMTAFSGTAVYRFETELEGAPLPTP